MIAAICTRSLATYTQASQAFFVVAVLDSVAIAAATLIALLDLDAVTIALNIGAGRIVHYKRRFQGERAAERDGFGSPFVIPNFTATKR